MTTRKQIKSFQKKIKRRGNKKEKRGNKEERHYKYEREKSHIVKMKKLFKKSYLNKSNGSL